MNPMLKNIRIRDKVLTEFDKIGVKPFIFSIKDVKLKQNLQNFSRLAPRSYFQINTHPLSNPPNLIRMEYALHIVCS